LAVIIREATRADAAAILALYGPYVTSSHTTFETEMPTVRDIERRLQRNSDRFPWLVITDEILLGYAYAAPYRGRDAYQWSCEVSCYVAADRQGHGLGTLLYERLFCLLRLQGIMNAHAAIALPNDKSCAFHERVGFRPVGVFCQVGFKLGRWHDVSWFSRALLPKDNQPRSPKEAKSLRGTVAWQDALSAPIHQT